jgi:hypothetical protein
MDIAISKVKYPHLYVLGESDAGIHKPSPRYKKRMRIERAREGTAGTKPSFQCEYTRRRC